MAATDELCSIVMQNFHYIRPSSRFTFSFSRVIYVFFSDGENYTGEASFKFSHPLTVDDENSRHFGPCIHTAREIFC